MCFFHRYLLVWALTGLVSLSQPMIPSVRGQTDISGIVDLDTQMRQKITKIRSRLNSDLDMAAEKQVVLLQWLIELLESTGNLEDIRDCYERILSFYPNDVKTLNDYGEFLFETAGDTVMAQKVLRDAAQYTQLINTPTSLAGRTYFLLGKLHHQRADHSRAVEYFETARLYLGSEVTEPHLRLLGLSFVRLGRYDQAVQTWLELIGEQKGLNNNDIDFFRQIHRLAGHYRDQAPDDLIAQAVSNQRDRRRRELQALGANLVSVPTTDGYRLAGSLYSSTGKQAVLFVPEPGYLRSAWRVYAQLLHLAGITNLAFDLRGHGDSRNRSLPSIEHLTPEDWARFPDDIKSALSFLDSTSGRIFNQLAIVAAGAGCSWVEQALHNRPETTGVLYISPLFDAEDLELAHAIAFRRDRPTLIIYSAEDVLAAASSQYLSEAKPLSHLEIIRLSQAGHGIEALNQDMAASSQFENWVYKILTAAAALDPAE
jgi:pimeloyl-ACP methyl ester carboxylesterase